MKDTGKTLEEKKKGFMGMSGRKNDKEEGM